MRAAAGVYAGSPAAKWAVRLGVPAVVALDEVGSTQDVAHELAAAGAESGTVVVAARQSSGRGREGRRWSAPAGHGVWLTVLARELSAVALEVLSLRIGLAAASALEPFAPSAIGVKWPNDLYVAGRKLAGTLVEARWRGAVLEWVALGFGVNLVAPADQPGAAALAPGTDAGAAFGAAVAALRRASAAHGALTAGERAAYAARDVARGRACREPVAGRVAGISARGELLVEHAGGITAIRSGSLILD